MTWTPRTGSTVKRNERLYEVDGRAVWLMYGSGPMYRTLKPGDRGRDVEQLERNLAELGYTGFTPDDEYTELTAAAVKRWQKSHDSERTGTVGPQDIAFSPGRSGSRASRRPSANWPSPALRSSPRPAPSAS